MKIAVAIRLLNENLELQNWTIERIREGARHNDCALCFYPTNRNRFQELVDAGQINPDGFVTSRAELLQDANALYVRNIGNKGKEVYSLVREAIKRNIPVYDPCIEAQVNSGNVPSPNSKSEMATLLIDAGVRTPQTTLHTWEQFKQLDPETVYGNVVKLNRGGRRGLGTYMMRNLRNKDKLQMVIDDLEENHELSIKHGILVQEWVKAVGGDWRLVVVHGEVIGCFRRGKRKATFQATTSSGKSTHVPLDQVPANLKEMCATAAQVLGLSICSIDAISIADGGHCIIEVNEAPSFKAFKKKTTINPMSVLFAGIKRQVE